MCARNKHRASHMKYSATELHSQSLPIYNFIAYNFLWIMIIPPLMFFPLFPLIYLLNYKLSLNSSIWIISQSLPFPSYWSLPLNIFLNIFWYIDYSASYLVGTLDHTMLCWNLFCSGKQLNCQRNILVCCVVVLGLLEQIPSFTFRVLPIPRAWVIS